jgi:hypothetical protein
VNRHDATADAAFSRQSDLEGKLSGFIIETTNCIIALIRFDLLASTTLTLVNG